jgi:hypothetical protein
VNSNQNQDDLQQTIAAIQAQRRRSQMKWAAVGVLVVAVTVTLYFLGFRYREELFRPKPNMEEIEAAAFSISNDPACREMIKNVDDLQVRWKERRKGLRDLLVEGDAAAVEAGRLEVQHFLEAYKLERRRLPIIIVHDSEVPGDILRYLKHITHYLNRMDELLGARLQALKAPAEDAAEGDAKQQEAQEGDTGEARKGKKDKKAKVEQSPEELYSKAWSAITEDHEKWRVFRQGPLPCGKREGEVPPLPEEIPVTRKKGKDTIRMKTLLGGSKAEPKKAEPKKAEPKKAEPKKAEPRKADQ